MKNILKIGKEFVKQLFSKNNNSKSKKITYDDDVICNQYILAIENKSKTKDQKVSLFGALVNTNSEVKNFGSDEEIKITPFSGYPYSAFLLKTLNNEFKILKWRLYIKGENAKTQIKETMYIIYINVYNGNYARIPIVFLKINGINVIETENELMLDFYYPVKVDAETRIEFNLLAGNKIELHLFAEKNK